MVPFTRSVVGGCVAFAPLSIGACGGGGDGGTPAQGAISISMTDAPVDGAAEVTVVFTGIELHRSNAGSPAGQSVNIDFSSNKSIDLLELQDGVTSALTQDSAVPAGQYDWMGLEVLASKNSQGESYIKLLSGEQYPLWTITAIVDLAALAVAQLGAGASVDSCEGGIYLFSGGTATPDDQDVDSTDATSTWMRRTRTTTTPAQRRARLAIKQ